MASVIGKVIKVGIDDEFKGILDRLSRKIDEISGEIILEIRLVDGEYIVTDQHGRPVKGVTEYKYSREVDCQNHIQLTAYAG